MLRKLAKARLHLQCSSRPSLSPKDYHMDRGLAYDMLRLGAIDAAPGYIVSLSSVEEISQNHRDFGAARPGCDKSMRPGSWQSAAGRSRHAGARNARPSHRRIASCWGCTSPRRHSSVGTSAASDNLGASIVGPKTTRAASSQPGSACPNC